MSAIRSLFAKNNLKTATIILMVTTFLSNILGVFRDHFLAQKIPTNMLDTYYAAFRIPDLIFNLLILGAMSSAFIPVFSDYLHRKRQKEAFHISNSYINLSITAIILISAILFFVMPWLVKVIVPRFPIDKQLTTVYLSRIFLITPPLFGISYILSGILNSFHRFIVFSLAPLIYNLSIIFATLLFAGRYGVVGVAVGVIVGAFLHMAIQVPVVYALGYKYHLVFDWTHKGVKKITKLMIPRVIGLGAGQIIMIINTAIASAMIAGSVAIFNLANNIQTLFPVVFGASLSIAIFPTLSEAASGNRKKEFISHFALSFRRIMFFIIPASAGLIIYRAQIIRVVLGSGFFSWQDTNTTAAALGAFIVGLFAQTLLQLVARAFYAYQDTNTPTVIGIICLLINAALAFLFGFGLKISGLQLIPKWGVPGLALATSIAAIVNFWWLTNLLKKKLGRLSQDNLLSITFKYILATVVMSFAIQLIKIPIAAVVNMHTFWGVLTQLFVGTAVGLAIYVLVTNYLKCNEIKSITYLFHRNQPSNKAELEAVAKEEVPTKEGLDE